MTQNPTDKQEISKKKEIRRITWIGLIANLLISVVKFIVGTVGSSQAIVADAVHSLSDSITDIAILVGVHYWSAPADDNHPYGHRRIEAIVTAAIGVILALVAIGIGYNAITTIPKVHTEPVGWIAFIGAAISIVAKEILYRWTITTGKKTKSSALIANAWHHRSDAISSVPAAIAVLISSAFPGLYFVDHIGAVIVSLFILHAAWKIMKPVFMELSDAAVSKDVEKQIQRIVLSSTCIESVHAIRTRLMGSAVFVDLHIMVDGNLSINKGHEISHVVVAKIKDNMPDVIDVVVHLEPGGIQFFK